ncbi:pyruvate kinase-like protein [Apodospora peruviana]|uniref:Pyruvate kinase-like protein n=1 Tax=Apodospora peruviana TaxID=516989 RepID=A0AAE0IHF3_9PEZI|nr:pyruvate kinase-like protein [Apodospora peruviana]
MAQNPQPPATPAIGAPDFSDVILEVRMGKMKPMPGLTVDSGIDKSLCDGPVHVTTLGIEGDEHDLTFHGGPEKAIHGYCLSNYPLWQSEHPSAASRFRAGGFGENFVLANMSERNVCIGDIYSVCSPISSSTSNSSNDGCLLLQVSLPRQPCFKLNHRFQLKNFAPLTYKFSRTGWYYRVLREGRVKAGDEIRLVERKHPQWTIERVQEYLHRNQRDVKMNEILAGVEELGAESRGMFAARVAKQKAKERRENRERDEQPKKDRWREFMIIEKTRQTDRVTSFVLEAVKPLDRNDVADDKEEVDLDPGAHAKIKLPNGLVRVYSIVDGDKNRFQLGIAYDGTTEGSSRGGSKYLHTQTTVGDTILVNATITNAIPIASAASNHVFVVGGIGITAFLALAELYKKINYSFTLHYVVRNDETDVPFKERIEKLGGEGSSGTVFVYDKQKGNRMDIGKIVREMPWNSQLYFCGPKKMMEEAQRVVEENGIGEKEVHWEAFEADIVGGDPFEAVVANRDNAVIHVGGEETLLEKLQERFGDDAVESSCCVGNCGTCRVELRDGRVEHRGTALSSEEKGDGAMLACVSRGVWRIVIEI